ncbi:hypothetical protein P692DRAFT_20881744 [Suillus brevipes Sb2]|nr:hypothetical protein P692DRAFT_20881744 [Suillus brevipes Sb2]
MDTTITTTTAPVSREMEILFADPVWDVNLYFQPLRSGIALTVREVKGTYLSRLITVRGIVTRVS